MNNSIYVALQNVLKANEPVKFFNTFRGMPVNYSGNIIRITGARVSFRVSRLQINCMTLNHGTYLKINRNSGIVRAKLADYDMSKETVDLWGFENMINTIGYRTDVRVETRNSLGGVLSVRNDLSIPVSIVELSIRGISFIFDVDLFDTDHFTIGKRMSIAYHIPTVSSMIKSSVVSSDIELRSVVVERNEKIVRIGARTYPDKKNESAMINYLAYRQKELLAELKALCESNFS
jgi:hypothetical protein